jgi:hypothetical protein
MGRTFGAAWTIALVTAIVVVALVLALRALL